jgi:hypothetical protein
MNLRWMRRGSLVKRVQYTKQQINTTLNETAAQSSQSMLMLKTKT